MAGGVEASKNAITSLGKADDEATTALMALFYDKLWRDNKPPVEAFRQAQPTLYHHLAKIALEAGSEQAYLIVQF